MGNHGLLPGGGGFRAVPAVLLAGPGEEAAGCAGRVHVGEGWEAERRPQAQRAWWSRLTASQDDLASVSPNC